LPLKKIFVGCLVMFVIVTCLDMMGGLRILRSFISGYLFGMCIIMVYLLAYILFVLQKKAQENKILVANLPPKIPKEQDQCNLSEESLNGDVIKEDAEFLKVLMKRLYINMAESTELKTAILAKFIEAVTEEVSDIPILKYFISDIIISDFTLGKKPPELLHVTSPLEPLIDTVIEFALLKKKKESVRKKKSNNAKLRLKTKFIFSGMTNIDIRVMLQLERLEGTIRLIIPPHPSPKMHICFVSVPLIDITVVLKIGSKRGFTITSSQIPYIHKINQ